IYVKRVLTVVVFRFVGIKVTTIFVLVVIVLIIVTIFWLWRTLDFSPVASVCTPRTRRSSPTRTFLHVLKAYILVIIFIITVIFLCVVITIARGKNISIIFCIIGIFYRLRSTRTRRPSSSRSWPLWSSRLFARPLPAPLPLRRWRFRLSR